MNAFIGYFPEPNSNPHSDLDYLSVPGKTIVMCNYIYCTFEEEADTLELAEELGNEHAGGYE